MDNGRELIDALVQVSHEKGIDKEIIFEAIEASLVSACKKHFGPSANVRVVVDRENGEYVVLATKIVTEKVEDEMAEISLEDARKLNSIYELGDTLEVKIKPGNFGRISAQTAKQVVVQKFREAEREILYNDYIDKQHKIVTGVVQRRDRRSVIISLGKLEAFLPTAEQIPRELYHFNERIRVYVLEVKQSSKGPIVNVSRTHPELLKYLFEQEIPEIRDGIVEVKAVAREAGNRSKVAVFTKHPHIDPIGACVGQNGQRINMISSELRGEKIDVVQWNEDSAKFISAALGPSKVVAVAVNKAQQVAHAVVPDHQLSLAIGKEGQNARLAARLTGWRIDIKSESQAAGTDFLVFPEQEVEKEDLINLEAAYADFYESEPDVEPIEDVEVAAEEASETIAEDVVQETVEEIEETIAADDTGDEELTDVAADEYYDDEYYDDEYYDDEYYDDEYYDDEYYDDEYYYDYETASPEADQETADE
ncbi:MAG: transcription termination factor NusA [Firmicutes bacterium]|nr:transcription termination factor NusA [Bacillota bacterium]